MVVVVVVVRDAVNRSVSVAVTVALVFVTVTTLVVGVMMQEHAERTNKGRNFLRTRKSETETSAEGGERGVVQPGTSISPRSSRSRRAITVGSAVLHVDDVEKLVLVLLLVLIVSINYDVVKESCVLQLARSRVWRIRGYSSECGGGRASGRTGSRRLFHCNFLRSGLMKDLGAKAAGHDLMVFELFDNFLQTGVLLAEFYGQSCKREEVRKGGKLPGQALTRSVKSTRQETSDLRSWFIMVDPWR